MVASIVHSALVQDLPKGFVPPLTSLQLLSVPTARPRVQVLLGALSRALLHAHMHNSRNVCYCRRVTPPPCCLLMYAKPKAEHKTPLWSER